MQSHFVAFTVEEERHESVFLGDLFLFLNNLAACFLHSICDYLQIENGSEITLETLAIRVSDDRIVYEATVLNQNDGQTIPFTLTADIDRSFVFENPEHDFPKTIIYQRMNNGELLVRVLGDDEKGFSMKFVRQND